VQPYQQGIILRGIERLADRPLMGMSKFFFPCKIKSQSVLDAEFQLLFLQLNQLSQPNHLELTQIPTAAVSKLSLPLI